MDNTLILTLLPNGFAADDQLRLSVVAGFQLDPLLAKFEASPITVWPRLSNELVVGALQAGTDEPIAVTRAPAEPANTTLWDAIFNRDAPVGDPPATTAEADAYRNVRTPLAHGAAHRALTGLYDEARVTSPTAALRPDHPVALAVRALAELTGDAAPPSRGLPAIPAAARELLDPDRLTPSRLDDAVRELSAAGRPDAARLAALAPAVRRQRAAIGAAAPPAGPGPLAGIKPIQRADVQQVLGLILDHPALARRLGLIIDLLAAVPVAGIVDRGLIRADVAADAPVRQIFDRVRLPASRIRLDRSKRLFVMATQPGAGTEVVNGMLDLSPVEDKYELSDLDVHGLTRQLGALGRRLDADGGPVTLPMRRDAGLTLTQAGRAAVLEAAIDAVDLWSGPPEEVEGEPVLYADDVTEGYRIDVSRNGRPFRSLMRRHVEYRIGALPPRTPTLTADDEGMVEALVAVEQADGAAGVVLDVGEAMVGWDGFSLAARRPGAVVDPGAPGGTPVNPKAETVPGYPVEAVVVPTRGTVTPLRYGDTYALRARAVDLAGNSLGEADHDSGQVTKTVRFLRHQQVAAPTIVAVRPIGGGETLTRVIARSDGDGNPLDGPAERHLAPPPSSQQMAERHGMFDAAIGSSVPATERERLRVIAGIHGTFDDQDVTLSDGTTVPAEGFGVATTPAGQYTFHDTDRLRVPYLPDTLAVGATMIAQQTTGERVVTVAFGDERWPDARPARLTVSAASTTSFKAETAGPTQRIAVGLAPGQEVAAELSSPLRPGLMTHLDPVPTALAKAAREGLVPWLSLRSPITMLHATRKPAADPILTLDGVDERKRGDTDITFRAQVTFHAATTGKVDVVAAWDEVIDPAVGDVITEPRRITLASFTPKQGDSSFTVQVRHDFGDTRHRAVRLFAVAATKFRDCFPELAEGDPLTLREGPVVELDVLNTRVPPPLQIHSVVPTYRWVRQQSPGRHEAVRHARGMRIYVERPGATTGDGEELGVVVYRSQAIASSLLSIPGRPHVARWGDDPLEQDVLPQLIPPLAANFPAGVATQEPLTADLGHLGNDADITTVIGHPLRFAADRGLWYADVDISGLSRTQVFLRLGVVRRQSNSIAECRLSRTRDTGWFTMPVSVGVALQAASDAVTQIRVSTAGALPKVEVMVAPRFGGGSLTDILASSGAVSTLLGQVSPANTGISSPFLTEQLGFGLQSRAGSISITVGDPALTLTRWNGRIVVQAMRTGSDFVEDKESSQPIFLEVIDFADLHGPPPDDPF
jgi:hypothetical protein